jgi:hypothetical protein
MGVVFIFRKMFFKSSIDFKLNLRLSDFDIHLILPTLLEHDVLIISSVEQYEINLRHLNKLTDFSSL